MTLVRLECRACRARLTSVLTHLPAVPERQRAATGGGYLTTVQTDQLATDPEPVATHPDGTATSTLGCLVAHPDAGRGLAAHPDPGRNSGCCGHDGLDGPNRLCSGCGAEVATLRNDCWSTVELRFEPDAVRLVPVTTA